MTGQRAKRTLNLPQKPPIKTTPIGWPSRDPKLDVLPGFVSPPPGYGEVAFYWWLGDPLTKERLSWQLDQLAGKGLMGLQINYAHSDKGGQSYGLTYPSEPQLFSKAWWDLVGWFLHQAKSKGMAVSLSDYTLGVGQGWAADEAIKKYPQITGSVLQSEERTAKGGETIDWTFKDDILCLAGFPSHGEPESFISAIEKKRFKLDLPKGKDWRFMAIWARKIPSSIDPMNPLSGKAYIEKFFQPFEDINPGEAGKGLNFFFSDELGFGLNGKMWNGNFADAFRKLKGYNLEPNLAALFTDIGPTTPKVRMDYNDVVVRLSEQGFFKPVFDWHQKRGMTYGCDHGGRGRDVAEFGDYFRTQKWNQGPGCDQPGLSCDLVKNKVASSIAHLYNRPRVWLEGYHSSGWATSSAQVTQATIQNFLQGQNLLTFHGLYYSTHGGWWEWAPPENHWRMPYWQNMDSFYRMQERLSYLLSQGDHVADAAILYPVAPVEAGMDGGTSVDTAFKTCEALYANSFDLDFMDFESLDRAKVKDGKLCVAGEKYRVLILPSMKAVRFSTLQSTLKFVKSGGLVVAIGSLPEASDRIGRNDPEVTRLVTEIFGIAKAQNRIHQTSHEGGGFAFVVPSVEKAVEIIKQRVPADIVISKGKPSNFMHRRVGSRDVYALYGAGKGQYATFRATGKAELWDPWTGQVSPLPVFSQDSGSTSLWLPLGENELQIIVFSPGKATLVKPNVKQIDSTLIRGEWECEPKPVLDNRWGDFVWPPTKTLIGPSLNRVRYAPDGSDSSVYSKPDFDDSAWTLTTCGYGPKFIQFGPMPVGAETERMGDGLATAEDASALPGAKPYSFSWRWGVEGDRGHQGYHGLKELMYSEFIRLGRTNQPWAGDPTMSRIAEPEGTRYYLWTTVLAPRDMEGKLLIGGMKPARIWLNGSVVASPDRVSLKQGSNRLLVQYDSFGTGYVVAVDPSVFVDDVPKETEETLAMPWFGAKGVLPFDSYPLQSSVGWFRFKAPPGTKSIRVPTTLPMTSWVDGKAVTGVQKGSFTVFTVKPSLKEASVCLRIEQPKGEYAGSALSDPVQLECSTVAMELGDWSKIEGFRTYSGGMRYRKTVQIAALQKQEKLFIDLGSVVSSAELWVNGKRVGEKVAGPWRFDITSFVISGANKIEVIVYNTLANHYLTVPTGYGGDTTSGLMGPVRLERER